MSNFIQHVCFSQGDVLQCVCDGTNKVNFKLKDPERDEYIVPHSILEGKIPNGGQPPEYIKAKFVDSRFGLVVLLLSKSRNFIDIFRYGKISFEESEWKDINRVEVEQIEDFDTLNNSKSGTFKMIVVTLQGKCFIYQADNFTMHNLTTIWVRQIFFSGCSCVSVNNYEGFNEEFAIGGYAEKDSDETYIKIYRFNKEENIYEEKKVIESEGKGIIEVKWGYQIGKQYSYICSSDLNGTVHFWKISSDLEDFSDIGVISNKAVVRCLCWNSINKVLTGVDEKGEKFIGRLKANQEAFEKDEN